MVEVFYEDNEIIVVKKPAGIESQARHSFDPDMVSEIRNHIRAEKGRESYVGVVHRLDRPVSGIMVYAKTKEAAASLSAQIQAGSVRKVYRAVVCGRCVDNVGNFVDYLLKDPKENVSKIVEKGINGARRAELKYRVLGVLPREAIAGKMIRGISDEGGTVKAAETEKLLAQGQMSDIPDWAGPGPLSLVEIELLTGRHHQIRVQFAGRGLPLWGDSRYGGGQARPPVPHAPRQLALCACGLSFVHPAAGGMMTFSMEPEARIFRLFGEGVRS